jgi:membrane-bound ClpP family serine protease
VSKMIWIPAAILMGTGAIVVALVVTRIRRQTRKAREEMGGDGASGLQGYPGRVESLSESSAGVFRGKVLIRGEIWDFESEQPVVVGDPVQVMKTQGFKVFVSKVV